MVKRGGQKKGGLTFAGDAGLNPLPFNLSFYFALLWPQSTKEKLTDELKRDASENVIALCLECSGNRDICISN
jgi:hypothetical protein